MDETLEKEREIGKLQVALCTRGRGVMLFAFWSFLRTFMISFAGNGLVYGTDGLSMSLVGTLILDFIIGAIDFGLRAYVGRCAVSFSQGGKLHRFSLFLAGFFAAVPLLIIGLYFLIYGFSDLMLSVIIGLVVDAALVILNVQIIVFSLRLKKAGYCSGSSQSPR